MADERRVPGPADAATRRAKMNEGMGLNADGSEKPRQATMKEKGDFFVHGKPPDDHPVLKAVSDLKDQLSAMLDPTKKRQLMHGGKTVDQTVEEALSRGIDEANNVKPGF